MYEIYREKKVAVGGGGIPSKQPAASGLQEEKNGVKLFLCPQLISLTFIYTWLMQYAFTKTECQILSHI